MKRALFLLLLLAFTALNASAQRFRSLEGHTGPVDAVAISPDGKMLASASADHTVKLWDLQSGTLLTDLKGHTVGVYAVAFSPDGKMLASGDASGSIRIWDPAARTLMQTVDASGKPIESLTFCPDNNSLAAAGADSIPRIFDLRNHWNQEFHGAKAPLYGVAVSPDGQFLAASGIDEVLHVWSVATGRQILTITGHTNSVRSVAFSPDGKWLATGSLDRTVRIWDATTGSLYQALPPAPNVVRKVAFSPDGRMLAAACKDGAVRLYDLRRNNQLAATLEGQHSELWDLCFSKDGALLATACADHTARVWDISFLELGGADVAAYTPSEDRFNPTVDIANNIPDIGRKFDNRFALVIGNEFYSQFQRGLTDETNVEYARSDASLFATYAQKTLGVPERNLLLLLDASAGQMQAEIRKLVLLAKNYGPNAEIFIYYAGHGVPAPETGESLLLPVDVNANQPDLAISLRSILDLLGEVQTARTTIFLDACFSGLARDASPLADRGVRIRPKAVQATGNTVVFSAAGADQAALPYRQAKHGLYTYFLLKNIHESSGINYGILADRLENEVALNALLIHNKRQNPVVTPAPEIGDAWKFWKLTAPNVQE